MFARKIVYFNTKKTKQNKIKTIEILRPRRVSLAYRTTCEKYHSSDRKKERKEKESGKNVPGKGLVKKKI
jgi:hypothetical protein